MPIESDFRQLMPDPITVEPFVSRDAYGQPAFGAPAAFPARVVRQV